MTIGEKFYSVANILVTKLPKLFFAFFWFDEDRNRIRKGKEMKWVLMCLIQTGIRNTTSNSNGTNKNYDTKSNTTNSSNVVCISIYICLVTTRFGNRSKVCVRKKCIWIGSKQRGPFGNIHMMLQIGFFFSVNALEE